MREEPIKYYSKSRTFSRVVILLVLTQLDVGDCAPSSGERTQIINTRYGQVQGTYRLATNGEKVATYLGIPYAAPPINKNRLNPTRTTPMWQRVLQAVSYGPSCPQNPPKKYAHLLRQQSEDCLYLNIFVPLGTKDSSVLVIIPGESYIWGSASLYDPSLLASKGRMVVVTLNYRIGILGFLNPLGDGQKRSSVVNYGMMDQIAALHWVQENIARFGGDKTKVTVMGRSNAAACIAFLIISPASSAAKLFQRAILMSGTALSPWSLVQNSNHFAQEVSKQLHCDLPLKNLRHDLLYHCVRNRTVDQILRIQLENPQFLSAMGPTIDGVTISANWQQELSKISRDGKSPVDLLIGIAEDDVFEMFHKQPYVNGFALETRDKIFRTFVTNNYQYHLQELLLTITAHYTDWAHPAQHPLTTRQLTMEALQDASLVAPSISTAVRLTAPHRSTYFYVLEASHSDVAPLLEMALVLGAPLGTNYPLSGRETNNYTKEERKLSDAMIGFWGNFVRTGNPNDPKMVEMGYVNDRVTQSQPYAAPIWEIFDPINRRYLELGSSRARLRNHYRSGRVALWTWLLPALEGVGARHGPNSPYHQLMDHHRLDTFSGPTRPLPLMPFTTSTIKPSTIHPPNIKDAELNGLGPNGSTGRNHSGPYDKSAEWLQAATGKKGGARYYPNDPSYSEPLSYSTTITLTAALGISLLLLNALVLATVHCRRNKRASKRARELSENATNANTLPSPSHCGTMCSSSTLRSISATPFNGSECPDYSSCPKQNMHLQGTPIHLQHISEQTTFYHPGHMSPQPQNLQAPPQELQYHAQDLHFTTNSEPMPQVTTFTSSPQYQQQQQQHKQTTCTGESGGNNQNICMGGIGHLQPQQLQSPIPPHSTTTVHC